MTGKSEKVPKPMQATFDAVTALTDSFCKEHLNDEYRQLARQVTAALCRKRPSPLVRGKPEGWACGVVYALGFVNFLFDKSNPPYMKAAELCERMGVSKGAGSAKAKVIRDALKMMQMDPDWCLPSLMADNLLLWMLSVNGIMMDIRRAPREIQEVAYRQDLIPYIPATDGKPAADQTIAGLVPDANSRVYQLKVTLLEVQPPVWRHFHILGENTLYDLHCVLQVVMGWQECHLHEFIIGDARYSTLYEDVDLAEGVVEDSRVRLNQVASEEGMKFAYVYDFGDGWKHEILVQKILEPDPKGYYPVCLGGERACPPEDCGGSPGYEDFLAAIRDPKHEEHARMLEWVGGSFDPEAFDVKAANQGLRTQKIAGYIR